MYVYFVCIVYIEKYTGEIMSELYPSHGRIESSESTESLLISTGFFLYHLSINLDSRDVPDTFPVAATFLSAAPLEQGMT